MRNSNYLDFYCLVIPRIRSKGKAMWFPFFSAGSLVLLLCVVFGGEIALGQEPKLLGQLTKDRGCLSRGFPKNFGVRLNRRYDLEDTYYLLQKKTKGEYKRDVIFYELEDTGVFISSPSEQYVQSSTVKTKGFIAVANNNSVLFRLYPCIQSLENFSLLRKSASIKIENESDARSYAFLAYYLNFPGQLSISSEFQLRQEVEESFYSRMDKGYEKRFRNWEKKNRKELKRIEYDPPVIKKSDGTFDVSFLILTGSLRGNSALDKVTLNVSRDGAIRKSSINLLQVSLSKTE